MICMAAGDIEVYTADADDDGTKLDTALTGNSITVSDRTNMVVVGSRIFYVVVKAA